MSDYFNVNEFRASSSAFQWGEMVFTDYKTGCLRKILLQSKEQQATIDPKYGILGKINEDRHEARLISEGKKYIREFEFKTSIPSVPEVYFSGHMDFLLLENTFPVSVDELKSVTSKNVKRTVIKNGEYNTENLAQTVAYMGEAKVPKARLIYTFYEVDTNNNNYYATDERIFNVGVDDFGKITVDSKPTQFTFNDVLAHRVASAKVIRDSVVAQRPYRWELNFVSPCTFCAFKEACDKFDSGEIVGTDAYVSYAKSIKETGK